MNDTNISRTHRHIPLAGSDLSVIEAGRGPPILLGHGYLWDWRMWEPQILELSRRYRVIVPEMWGHGGSGRLPDGARTPADLACHMIEMLDRLEIERCVVIGSSLGGMWGAQIAARAPDRVAGLVLMNSYLGGEPVAKRLGYAAMLDQVEAAGKIAPAIADAITPMFFGANIERYAPTLPVELRQKLLRLDSRTLLDSIVPLGRLIFDRAEALEILDKIEAPVLIMAGADDRARPAEESGVMARWLQTDLIVMPDCGHTATLEQPELVTSALVRFLDAIGWRVPTEEPRHEQRSLLV